MAISEDRWRTSDVLNSRTGTEQLNSTAEEKGKYLRMLPEVLLTAEKMINTKTSQVLKGAETNFWIVLLKLVWHRSLTQPFKPFRF
jgi:hypothetical protein